MSALLVLLLAVSPAFPAGSAARILTVCDDVQDPATLDPQKQFSEKNHTVVQQIYEGLVRFTPKGAIEPALAVSWYRRDNLRTRFVLRPGVTFHNGEPFDAAAVKFSIERYLDPKTGFPAFGYISSIDRVDVVDPLTVDLVTKFPDGLLLNRLAGFILIVPPGYVKAKGQDALHQAPIGTGAFRFVRWIKGREISLEKNPDYWMAGHPKVDALVFRYLPLEQQLAALRAGEVDIVTELPGTQTTEIMRAGIRVIKQPSLYAVTGSLNVGAGPLSDKRVRKALNLAVNKNDLIRYDLLGNGRVLATVTMPEEEGHDASLQPYAYDAAAARKLLKEAGYPDGFTMKAAVKVQGERAAKVIAKHWQEIGVKLDSKVYTDAELIDRLGKESWDMFLAGCPDPMVHSFFIQSIFLYSLSPYKVVKNEAYDALVNKMVTTLDDAARRREAERIDAYIHEEALLLFLYQRIKTHAVSPKAEFVPSLTGMPYFLWSDKRS